MSKEARRLGRGIASIVSVDVADPGHAHDDVQEPTREPTVPKVGVQSRFAIIPIASVRTNPAQPRRTFDEAALQALSESMKNKGTLQPIAVRPAEGGYELLAGERRLRAAALAGIDSLPAVIRPAKDEDLLELALIENVLRQDLNPLEKAQAYKNMHIRHGLSHDEIGKRMGEDRATVSNYIRLLDLQNSILEMLATGAIGTGHAKALLSLADNQTRLSLASRVASEGWSVRQTEAAVSKLKEGSPQTTGPAAKPQRPAVGDMEQQLSQTLGTRIRIKEGRRRHSGRITIEYYTLDDFERIIALLGVAREPA